MTRPIHYMQTVNWGGPSSPYKCGATDGTASNKVHAVTCPDCLAALGVEPPTPQLHTPPRMEDERGMTDGVFIFHDVHIEGCTLEVVPQLSGNVEVTVAYKEDGTPEDGALFTLSLFDRVNLLRALLHDFHYSREVGGPGDDQD